MALNLAPQFVFKISNIAISAAAIATNFPISATRAVMSLGQAREAFLNIKDSVAELAIERADFIWHGGEPLLVPLNYYEQIDLLQKEVFGAEFKVSNSVQTNLTVLSDRHIAFLERGFFENIGVSFDVHGEQRVDAKGRSRTDTVRSNMQKLMDRGIEFSAIAVLARATLPHIRQTYRYFDDLGIKHRVLAYYRTVSDEQSEQHGLGFDELVSAHKSLFDEWLASDRATPVDPIKEYMRYAVQYITGMDNDRCDRLNNERVFLVDVNGDVFNVMESYEREFCYGNLFNMPFRQIADSESRSRSIALSQDRMRRFCHQCEYFGSCPGAFMASATRVEREMVETSGCPVRTVLDHILDVFKRTGLDDFVRENQKANGGEPADENPALSVA